MDDKPVFILLHSPLVGPFTWQLVQQRLVVKGYSAVVPILHDDDALHLPYWRQHVESAVREISIIAAVVPLILVAHSGAGLLIPALCVALPNPVQSCIFVDAGIPQDGLSRLDLLNLEDAEFGRQFHKMLLNGGKFPNWNESDLQREIPEEEVRRQLIAELHPRSLPFFTEAISVPDRWRTMPCFYIRFSDSYTTYAAQARAAGWSVFEIPAGHFHMLTHSDSVTEQMVEIIDAQVRHNTK